MALEKNESWFRKDMITLFFWMIFDDDVYKMNPDMFVRCSSQSCHCELHFGQQAKNKAGMYL